MLKRQNKEKKKSEKFKETENATKNKKVKIICPFVPNVKLQMSMTFMYVVSFVNPSTMPIVPVLTLPMCIKMPSSASLSSATIAYKQATCFMDKCFDLTYKIFVIKLYCCYIQYVYCFLYFFTLTTDTEKIFTKVLLNMRIKKGRSLMSQVTYLNSKRSL